MILKADILVVGSGLAGTLLSLELAQRRPDLDIVVLSKKGKSQSSSYLAQGGIAAVLPGTDDTIEQHIQDTMAAGGYTNDRKSVEYFISRAGEAIATLEKWGVSFDTSQEGRRSLALEGGHFVPRVLHHKDTTGKHIMQQLHKRLGSYHNIRIIQDCEVVGLSVTGVGGAPHVSGAIVWDDDAKRSFTVCLGAVVLATGGVGSLFKYTTNPATAAGQGIALAGKAGARYRDVHHVQFHPTALWQRSGSHLSLISEALRGAGAVLRNSSGEAFMNGKHVLGNLAPRDIVARCIVKEMEALGDAHVFLDAKMISDHEWQMHFPGILSICKNAGIDPRKEWIPVVPAAHYCCGGIDTNTNGSTNVEGLFVLGESANTGLHGANRLASNSLLEATVMALGLAGYFAGEWVQSEIIAVKANAPLLNEDVHHEHIADGYFKRLQDIMHRYCGVLKTTSGLEAAAIALLQLEEEAAADLPTDSICRLRLELSCFTARQIIDGSLDAKENKGVFFNEDLDTLLVPTR